MERVMVTCPTELLDTVDAHAKRLGKKRSQVVREALGVWVAAQEQTEFEALLAQGYIEMADQLAAWAEEIMPLQMEAAAATWIWDE